MTTKTNTRNPALPLFAGLGARLKAVLVAIGEASRPARCAREAEALSQLSDPELAHRGLTRDGIVRHAFRDYLAH